MKILVTGAGGFIGKNFVAHLTRNYDVKCMLYKNNTDEQSFLESKGAHVEVGDITKKSSIKNITNDVDVVYNLAAQRRGWTKNMYNSYRVNVVGTKNIIKDSINNSVKHFIHCSTSSILGPIKNKPATEDYDSYDKSKVYYVTKYLADEVVKKYAKKIKYTIVMPPLVYGPHDHHHLPIFKAVKENKIHFVGKGNNLFQPTYIDDCVKGFSQVILNKKAYNEKFIIANDQPKTTKEIIYTIAQEMDKEISPKHLPKPISKGGSYFLEGLGKIFGFKPPLNERVYDWFTENHYFDTTKAKKILDYKADFDLREGIKKTIDWYENEGWL